MPSSISKYMIVLISLALIFTFQASAREYSFTWDSNPSSDNIIEYHIYFRPDSIDYTSDDYYPIEMAYPSFDPDNPSFEISLPEIGEEYCFAATAVDADGDESLFSDEVGDGETCGTYRGSSSLPPVTAANSGSDSDGESGGGCFLSILTLF